GLRRERSGKARRGIPGTAVRGEVAGDATAPPADPQARTDSRTAAAIRSGVGIHACSNDGAYGAGVDCAPTRITGASKLQKPSRDAMAASSAPTPNSPTA